MPQISIIKCDSYSPALLHKTVLASFDQIQFDLKLLEGACVAVKPNLLMPAKPERAIVTHPEFFRAVVRVVKENKGKPILIESPAVHSLGRVIQKTGYAEVIAEEGVEVASPNDTLRLTFDSGRKYRHFDISKAYFDADIILCLPKFKTHGITYITGAVKLLFGAIPGLEKAKMHLKIPDHDAFSEYLLDLYGAFLFGFDPPKKMVHLMDAIQVLEGEGPGTAGKPRAMNAVIAGENAVAVDYTAVEIAGLDVNKAVTITQGFERHFGLASPDDIQFLGDRIEDLQLIGYVPPKGQSRFGNIFQWPFNRPFFKNLFIEKPVPHEERCTLCYQCKRICPSEAITQTKGPQKIPAYDYIKCIRCYCCLEICPEAAIEKHRGRLQWLFGWGKL